MTERFTDRIVLVTGGGRGIGKRLALGFAARGAHVALLARSRGELDLAHLEILHSGGSSLRFAGDVRDREFLCEAANRIRAHYGRPVEILICAAGLQGPIGPFAEAEPDHWWEVFETNVRGAANACRAVLPGMIEARSGKIIALTGSGVARPRPNFSGYAASKAALARLIETIAAEVSEHNVQANCFTPGGTYTSITDEILKAGERAGWKDFEAAEQIRRTGGVPPERQLQLAFFLASPKSNHVTGRLIHVDDDWHKLADATLSPESYTLRRFHHRADRDKSEDGH
jgi:3-oxoacyl-[acyl-carrier protein] reductase